MDGCSVGTTGTTMEEHRVLRDKEEVKEEEGTLLSRKEQSQGLAGMAAGEQVNLAFIGRSAQELLEYHS